MNRTQALSATVTRLNTEYGEGTIMRLGDLPPVSKDAIPTGWPALDRALGIGGLPRGRVVEIYGDAGSGKTTLALSIAHSAERALYIDADYGLAPHQMQGLYMGQVDTLEQAYTMTEKAAPGFDLVVIDTMAALPTRDDLACDVGDFVRHPQAKLSAKALPRLTGTLARYGCTLVIVSQVRENPEIMFGNPLKSTGGNALKYFAAIRIETRRPLGRFCARVVKNKCAPPYREAA